MSSLKRLAGITLAVALSTVAVTSTAAAVPFCYCEIYCSNGVEIFGQAGSRYECSQFFKATCGGSGTWVCQYE